MASINFIKARRIHLAAMAVATTVHILPRTYFIDQIRFSLQYFERGIPKRLSPDVKQLYHEVLDDMKTPDELRQYLKPMLTPGSIPSYAGYILPKFKSVMPNLKCLICIPEIFDFKEAYDVPAGDAKGMVRKVYLKSGMGIDDREAFVLSKKAQKYALANVIHQAQHPLNYIYAILPAFVVGQHFVFLYRVFTNDTIQKFVEKSKLRRRGVFGGLILLHICCYLLYRDCINLLIEKSAYDNVILVDPEYVEGGVEYLDKKLWQNRIIRSSMPLYLKWMIREDGELTQYIRYKHRSLVDEKKKLEVLSNKS